MKVAIMTSLLAEWYVNVDSGHILVFSRSRSLQCWDWKL